MCSAYICLNCKRIQAGRDTCMCGGKTFEPTHPSNLAKEFNSITRIGPSQVHGMGCFATHPLKKGSLLVSNVLVVTKEDVKAIVKHTFPWHDRKSSICLSNATYVNYSDDNNKQNLKIKSIDTEALTKTFEATEDIIPGEELFLKY